MEAYFVDTVKEYIAYPHNRIKLHDLAVQEVTTVLANTADTQFPVRANVSEDEFTQRLERYEEILTPLQSLVALTTYWGGQEHLTLLGKILPPLTMFESAGNGSRLWYYLRWYPAIAILYAGGIGAIAAGNYAALAALLTTRVDDREPIYEETTPLVVKCSRPKASLGEESRPYLGDTSSNAPLSDYLFNQLNPTLEALLFLGADYKRRFDRFEILFTLIHVDLDGPGFIPAGRFFWKHFNDRYQRGAFNLLAKEAEAYQEVWPPLQAGLFGGSYAQFKERWSEVDEHIKRSF